MRKGNSGKGIRFIEVYIAINVAVIQLGMRYHCKQLVNIFMAITEREVFLLRKGKFHVYDLYGL